MIQRRTFLQFAGSTLAALGWSHLTLERQSLQYARVLAQDTRRKLALLVGVNRYPQSQRFLNLRGCATDVEMQRQLLIHRFKFHPNDIFVLSDDADIAPTRDHILTALEDHLINQAAPGDIVVFHFSGHGSRVLDPDPIHPDDLNSTFVPGDVAVDTEQVDDIMGRTLFLLMSALDTDQVTAVLDSCYAGGGTRGNVRIRAADGGRAFKPSDRELAYQDHWLSRLEAQNKIDRTDFLRLRQLGVAKGVVIAAAQRDQTAADVTFDGFDAGAFTYLLTQFLWQQTESLRGVVSRIRSDTRQLSGQLPLLDPPQPPADSSMYFVPDEQQTTPAEAVVTAQAGDAATLWLGGVHPDVITAFNRGATLNTANSSRPPLVVTERQGLLAQVRTESPLAVNTLLREQSRVVPPDLTLVIGIDPSLETAAEPIQTQINQWPRIQAVPAGEDGLYGTEVHYILGRMTTDLRQQWSQRPGLPEDNALGLFTQSLSDWLPGCFRPATEPVHSALLQLLPKLRSLLAARLLRVSQNAPSSQLAVQAVLDNLDTGRQLAQVMTGREGQKSAPPVAVPADQLAITERIQISVTNLASQPLYVGVIGVNPAGDLTILLPINVSEPVLIGPGQTQRIPEPVDNLDLTLDHPGVYEIMVLTSKTSFTQALKGLAAIASGERIPNASNPDQDFSGLNGLFDGFDTPRGESAAGRDQGLEAGAIATLSITIEASASL